jgi:hypothetical protein
MHVEWQIKMEFEAKNMTKMKFVFALAQEKQAKLMNIMQMHHWPKKLPIKFR